MSELKYHLVNSFSAASPTSGSQCAVVLLSRADPRMADDGWLQTIASNFSYPATSFVVPKQVDGGNELEYDIRWFAVGELPFCGHGTMGAANVLFTLHSEAGVIRFSAKPGEIIAKRQAEGVELSLPVIPLDNETQNADDLVAHIVQVSTITPGDMVDLVTFTWSGLGVVVELKPEFDLARASIDGRGLANTGARMVIFTQMAQEQGAELSIRSRVFLPDAIAVEDPATGSAHATLTGYYSTHPSPLSRLPGSVKPEGAGGFGIDAQQLSQRGGGMKARYENGRAIIIAKATEWARGSLPVQ